MNRRVKYLGIFGAILQIGIVAQFFWRLIRSQWMFLNFQEWTEDSFSLVLLSVWDYAAICCSLLGVIFMFRALAKYGYNAVWLRQTLWLCSIYWAVALFPLGTIFGLLIMFKLLKSRRMAKCDDAKCSP